MTTNYDENANDLLNTVVSSYHVLTDKLHLGRTRSIEWVPLLEDVAGVTLDRREETSRERDLERLADSFWIEELDPRADLVLRSRSPLAGDIFFLALIVLVIDEYKRVTTQTVRLIDMLRSAAATTLSDEFAVDLARRPTPEPEIAIACAREAAQAWARWVHRT